MDSPVQSTLDAAQAIEGIAAPVLIVADGRIAQANAAARALLGAYILGEDVRLAIRHPAAADLLTQAGALAARGPIDLFGLGGLDQHWQMHVWQAPSGARVVHLIDRTGEDSAERMRVDFVANASHELRTPLAAILGYVETLADDGDDADVRARFLGIIEAEAQRMQRLVEDLISLSRIEAGKYRPPDQRVDLARLIEAVCGELVDCTVAMTIEPVPPVLGDTAQLSQMLHNLIGNAAKYGGAKAPIAVRLYRGDAGNVRIAVSDQGEGIAPEHIPRLTERFYRVDPSRSRSAGGTGLGLAIVKHIVERHRGRLEIVSAQGQGTTVTVALPPYADVIKP